jgi:methylmalonyl-CoA mutase
MPDSALPAIPDLQQDFPPVSTKEWEALIRNDLKGADTQMKLGWQSEEGLSVQPFYVRADIETENLPVPGEFPFTRGPGRRWQEAQNFEPPSDAIRADHLHEAGATAVQELAFALAEGVETYRRTKDCTGSMLFVYSVGSNYFFEIAKLRSARLLWSLAMSAFDAGDQACLQARIHVRSSLLNKSFLDPYTNLLRVTTEAMSAVIGGCDSLDIRPFGFDASLAVNVQRVLREEAMLDRVLDAGGGSAYLEVLTNSLAREAWRVFQEIEATGGWTCALRSRMVETELERSRQVKAKAVASRERVLVGVNEFPNVGEQLATHFLSRLDTANLFPHQRLSEPFERIRQRTEEHHRAVGHRPSVLLLKRGDPKMRVARANFCLNFFGCAGFYVFESDDYTGSLADLIVLCSSDPEYIGLATEVCADAKKPVLVAGNPGEKAELKMLGVRGFIHRQIDAIATLTEWQNRLGVRPLPAA